MQILVVGAGVSGLSCAIRLLEHGHRVVVASAARTPNATSDRSAAAFTPFRANGDERLVTWTRRSFEAFTELEERLASQTGVRALPMTEYYFEPFVTEPWWFSAVGGGKILKRVPDRYAWGVRVHVPTIDMRRYMTWLEQRVTTLGGRFEKAHYLGISSCFERDVDAVVNTSGLGARELLPDAAMTPIRGQIVSAPNDIALRECFADSGQAGETTYVFPFEDRIVIGGTYEKGVEETVTDETALARIVERGRTILRESGHPRADDLALTRLSTWAGLRPARVIGSNYASIRVELERREDGRALVHDYGHAGVGVTVSWGCADEVVGLLGTPRSGEFV